MKNSTKKPIVGFPEEWALFLERHPSFHQALKNLQNVTEKTFIRDANLNTPADKIVFFMGCLCSEDFSEIFLLAANGYGFGALKLLRGFYEKTVTCAFIAKNKDQADNFLQYHFIHRGKLFKHAQGFFGNLENFIEKKEIEEAKKQFDKYKSKFQYISCKKCKTPSLMYSWSKMDLASMAKKTGLDCLYFPGYFHPTLQAHATTSAVINRLKATEEGNVAFDSGSQPDVADKALVIAHNLIIRALDMQNDYFSLNLDTEFQTLNQDFKAVWGDNKK
jgi:hypothetical protein